MDHGTIVHGLVQIQVRPSSSDLPYILYYTLIYDVRRTSYAILCIHILYTYLHLEFIFLKLKLY